MNGMGCEKRMGSQSVYLNDHLNFLLIHLAKAKQKQIQNEINGRNTAVMGKSERDSLIERNELLIGRQ